MNGNGGCHLGIFGGLWIRVVVVYCEKRSLMDVEIEVYLKFLTEKGLFCFNM